MIRANAPYSYPTAKIQPQKIAFWDYWLFCDQQDIWNYGRLCRYTLFFIRQICHDAVIDKSEKQKQ